MKQLNKDTKMMIVIVALVLFAGYYFLIRPQGANIAQAREDRARVEQSVNDLELLQGDGTGSNQSATSGADAAVLVAAIPPGDELAGLLRQLDAIATTSGMIQSSISPSPAGPNPLGEGGSIQIAITATGSQDAARAYLAQLMNMPRLVLIEQVGLHAQAGGSDSQLQVAARVFTTSAPVVTP